MEPFGTIIEMPEVQIQTKTKNLKTKKKWERAYKIEKNRNYTRN